MPLLSLKNKAPKDAPARVETIEVSGVSPEGESFTETLIFREPRVAERHPASKRIKGLVAKHAWLAINDTLLGEIWLLGACYVPDAGDGKIDPWSMFAELARESSEVFDQVWARFYAAFDSVLTLEKAKESAGNDFAETETSNSPSTVSAPLE